MRDFRALFSSAAAAAAVACNNIACAEGAKQNIHRHALLTNHHTQTLCGSWRRCRWLPSEIKIDEDEVVRKDKPINPAPEMNPFAW